jgi:tetraacyldisaccharide 4'-kinase
MRAPAFWRDYYGIGVTLLAPASLAFRLAGALRRAAVRPWRAPVPLLCVGGLVAGGSGKTPVAISLSSLLRRRGMGVHVLARGYGGRRGAKAEPLRVDPAQHEAREVGDEALLLAAAAPTWVCRSRVRAAKAAVADGAEVLVLDDGFQNPSLVKDVSFLVVDGTYGFGNRRVIPAGPLREPFHKGLARADAVVLVGENRAGATASIAPYMPVLRTDLVPGPEARELAGREVVAFAGIGDPEKFFRTLREIGCRLRATHAFDDHHPYAADEIRDILERCRALEAVAVTTEKDAVRMPPELRGSVKVLTVSIRWRDEDALLDLLDPVLAHG